MKTPILALLFATTALSQAVIYPDAGWIFPGLAGNAVIPVVQTYDQSVALWNAFFRLHQLTSYVCGSTTCPIFPTTITSSVTANATSIPLANITGLSVGNGVCVSPSATSCTSTATIVAYASGAPTYAGGTTYAKYATVTYSGTVYASTQASNTGREPDLNVPTWWTPYQFSASSVEVMRITAITPGTPPAGTVTVVRGDISQLGPGIGSAYSSGQVVTFTDLPNLTYFAESFYVNARASLTADPNNEAPTAVAAQNTITSTSTSNNSGALIH